MPINISDVVVNIGQISQINWIKDALLPFASVFLGAILAHKLNIHREQAQKIDELCAKMNIICNKSDFLLGNLMSYNEFLIEKIEAKYQENILEAVQNTIFIPDISYFDVNIEDYVFLSNYNTRFLNLIAQLNSQLQLFISCAETYKRVTLNNSIKHDQKILQDDDIQHTIGCLKTLRKSLEPTIEFAYILNCQLNKCCSMYFNFLYLENLQDINFIKESYSKYMSNIDETENVKKYNALFENFWIFPLNFPSRFSLELRKLKFKWRFICSFFLIDKFFNKEEKPTHES